jgi:hypothetical protein
MAASTRRNGRGVGNKILGDVSKKETEGDDWGSLEQLFQEIQLSKVAPTRQPTLPQETGIPTLISTTGDDDEMSDVSNVSNSTPIAAFANEGTCALVAPIVPIPGEFPEVILACNTTTYLKHMAIDLMDNVTASIDPNVLVEFQCRTRSLVGRSWGMVRTMNSRKPEKAAASEEDIRIDCVEDENYKVLAALEVQHAKFLAAKKLGSRQNRSRGPCPAHAISKSHNLDENRSSGERRGIEVSSDGGVVDVDLLGEEIEITRYQDSTMLLDSRDMNTEINVVDETRDTEDVVGISNEAVVDQVRKHPSERQRLFVARRFLRIKSKEQAVKLSPTTVPAKPQLQHDLPRPSMRSSGKTVSTMYSDESTTAMQSMQTSKSGWIRDLDIVIF